MDKRQKKKATCKKQEINLIVSPPSKKRQNDNAAEKDKGKEPPPSEVAVERCSEHSVTSESIGIGEFGMSTSRKGNVATFNIAIRESLLFPMVKFLGGTNTSLDYSTELMSVCGLLKKHCNIDDADARWWWEVQHTMVKGIHTDCQNNKIKMINQIFTGKYICECRNKKDFLRKHSLRVVQAWIREDKEEASTVITIALHCKCGSRYTEELEDEDKSEKLENEDELQDEQELQENNALYGI